VTPTGVRLSELMASLSLTADLGFGQPMEHLMRACLVAVRFAERIGLDTEQRDNTYWVTLLGMICTSESWELVKLFGDDIAYREGSYDMGASPLAQLRYMMSMAGPRRAAGLVLTGGKALQRSLVAHTEVTANVAERVGLGPDVINALKHTFARWDGKGVPSGVGRDAVPIATQLFVMADGCEVHHRLHGIDGVGALLQKHARTQFDPDLAAEFGRAAPELFGALDDETVWNELIAAEPKGSRPLSGPAFDNALEVLADIADLKSPWFGGHSRGVAGLAEAAGRVAGLPERDIVSLRRAALVHDLGRTGISNAIWDKPGALSAAEQERVRLHAYYTERMLRRPSALAGLAAVAAGDHERLDGSGYHRGVSGSAIPLLGRFLAVADAYHAMLEARPHRAALSRDVAASEIRMATKSGALDPGAADAVLAAAGHATARRPSAPAGLTAREVEVLVLVARGATTRQVAQRLGIAPKTAGNHIERIYAKIGASSRSTATLFAMQHGLLDTLEPLA
jgi:HD-GYP domain-containing protein (c-di-GMP phosphodiesterase class II)